MMCVWLMEWHGFGGARTRSHNILQHVHHVGSSQQQVSRWLCSKLP